MGRSHIVHITPIPSGISREAAVARLHDHAAMMQLNPLIIRHAPTEAPPNATKDEAQLATWYSITDIINYLPGGMAKGEVSYKACFYNLRDGIQTHVFAPAGVDIKSRWSIGGNMPDEPREPSELGVDKPKEGLYIKEEIELRCNMFMGAFVKRNLQNSHREVHNKIILKAAELQDKLKGVFGIEAETETRRQTENDPVRRAMTGSVSAPANSSRSRNQSREINTICTCSGTAHGPSCSFFDSADAQQHGNNPHAMNPFYANSIPTSASSYSVSSGRTPAVLDSSPSELHGSPARGQCLCTGGLHEEGCPGFPGLRLPQLTPGRLLSDQLPPCLQAGPVQRRPTVPALTAGMDTPQRIIPPQVTPQRPGEQAELPATTSPVESSLDTSLRPLSASQLEQRSSDKVPV